MSSPAETETSGEPAPEIDPMGPNGACYVCHMSFVKEEFARVHLANKITCIKCHGLSDKHANDENIGATKPDITFKREKIDESCDKCHKVHDVPPKEVIARFQEKNLAKNPAIVCIDCHGTHKIEQAAPQQ
jgi:formate-dependent nitrite reductase cytochrome c552 subunit